MINGKYRTFMVAILFFLIVTLFFYLLIVGVMPKYKTVSSKEDIATTDMAESYICLDASLSECYMGRLYSPEDFEKGILTQGDADAKYATNRITVPVEPGKTYGITGQSATYAQKVYVNGRLLSEIGCVSDNEADFVPKTDRYTVYFTADSDKAEIIIQNAWFNHVSGAFHKIYMAQQQVIIRHDRAETLCDGLITGTLLAMTIFFFGMFLFYQSRRSMLWFSLSCLCAAVHYLIYESKQIMVFFPDLNWYVGHKLEYITNSYYFLFMALFAASMLKLKFNKNFVKVTAAFVIALTLYYIIAPSQQYTKYIVPISGAVILYDIFVSIYMFYTALKRKLLKRWENIVVCMTVFLTAAVYVVEALTYFSHVFYIRSYAMILFSFCNAVLLTVSFSQAERELNEAVERERETTHTNEILEKMGRLRTDFMHNIAHEMKTPLAVMSGYAQLTKRQIEKNALSEETVANLTTVSNEAQRLSDMVTKLLSVSYSDVGAVELNRINIQELLEAAASVCRPILAKRNNELLISCEESTDIIANREALLQVLINLAVNACKHTQNGTVTFSTARAVSENGFVAFRIKDTGSGISEDVLPHIFDKGYSTDGGNGLGLGICKEIIESMGGVIYIEQTDKNGTTVYFTVLSGKEN